MTGTLSAGPGSPLGLGGLFTPVPVKTTAYTANPGEFVPCDTTAMAFTVTLPSQPQDGAAVEVKMVRQGGTNAVTVATAGGDTVNAQGGGTSQSLPLLYQGAVYQYRAAIGVWYVLGDDLALSQLDARYAPAGGSGSGTVTSASVVSANGLAGTVATPTTTPAITLSTPVNGLVKGNGTAFSAAAAGTDYLAPNGSGAALTGITAGQVGADASGAAAAAQAASDPAGSATAAAAYFLRIFAV